MIRHGEPHLDVCYADGCKLLSFRSHELPFFLRLDTDREKVSGDRENVDVIAHELSHSWSGNLVTAGSWEHL